MTIHELFNNGILQLPLQRQKNEQFRPFIQGIFNNFIQKVRELDLTTALPDTDKNRIYILVSGIANCMDLYLDGSPMQAYETLKKAFDDTSVALLLISKNYPVQSNLYRLRVDPKEAGYHLPKKELFHIPFNLRHLVKTQRFSIPGFPCIYLSNSIYVAWEEMRRPELSRMHSIRFQNQQEIKYLDLSTTCYQASFNSDQLPENILLQYLITWPLIAACSVKVLETEAAYKPEYIIPQIVLQWVRNEKKHDAIMFSSTHIDQNRSNTTGNLYNFVLPVIKDSDNGHCSELLKMFKSTEALSWQLYQASMGGLPNLVSQSGQMNPDVGNIELIKGHVMPYESSPLAALEFQLNNMLLDYF